MSIAPVPELSPTAELACGPARALIAGQFYFDHPGSGQAAHIIVRDRGPGERRITADGLDVVFDPRRVIHLPSEGSVALYLGQDPGVNRTQALVESLQRLGPEASPEALGLSNCYALVWIDLRTSTLTLRTDRFATVPLCYRSTAGAVAFSDRADSVPGASAEAVDLQALFNYVHGHTIAAPRTIFHGVRRVESAVGIFFGPDGAREFRTWQPQFATRTDFDLEASKARFLDLLRDAVNRSATNERLGCFLSGGTDSSTVVGMLARSRPGPIETYSIGFAAEGYDEMAYARIAARHFGTDHHEHYVTPDDLLENIPRVAAYCDQPFGNSSVLPAYCCAHMARERGVERMLAGDGGDELFGGNSRYARQKLLGIYKNLPTALRSALIEPLLLRTPLRHMPPVRRAASYVEQASAPMPERMEAYNLLDRFGADHVFTSELMQHIDAAEPGALQRAVYGCSEGAALVDRMLAYDWRFTLADTDLPKVHWATRLAALDVGYPLLDDALVDFSLTLPASLKVRGMKLRWFFKEALKDFLPPEIIRKQKHGFGLPFGPWLLQHDGLRRLAQTSLRQLVERNVIRAALVEDLFSMRLQQHAGYYGEMVWILMMLEQWLVARAPGFSVPRSG